MSVFGIDFQPSLTTIAVRETAAGKSSTVSIGDGFRRTIPNLVSRGESWGSAVAGPKAEGEIFHGNPGPNLLWLEEPGVSLFWRGLAQHLKGFLGGVTPSAENGYTSVVALQALDYIAAKTQLIGLAQKAGLIELQCIRATEALLCWWLAEGNAGEALPQTVSVVVCGDERTHVTAFEIDSTDPKNLQISSSGTETVLRAGQNPWAARLLKSIRERTSAPTDFSLQDELSWRDAALGFAARLTRSTPDKPVAWTGPLSEGMFTNFRLSRNDCNAWQESSLIRNQLRPAVVQSLSPLPTKKRAPDLVLLGGIGAVWPFAHDGLAGLNVVTPGIQMEQSIARGATYWPILSHQFNASTSSIKVSETGRDHWPTTAEINSGPSLPDEPTHGDKPSDILPWLR